MNSILEDINKQKQEENYIKARNDLIKALDSFSKLDNAQRQQLIVDLVGVQAATDLYRIMQNNFR